MAATYREHLESVADSKCARLNVGLLAFLLSLIGSGFGHEICLLQPPHAAVEGQSKMAADTPLKTGRFFKRAGSIYFLVEFPP
jgi:hypothetical protein